MLARASATFALACATVVGCGDLFHGTDWATACQLDDGTPGCGGAASAHGASSGARSSSSTGGAGGAVASTGSAGAGTSHTASASSTSGSSTSGSSTTTTTTSSGTGGGSTVGCSDGTREGFSSVATYPTLAACSGGFALPGVATAPACGRLSGNSTANPSGIGCSAGDLCAAGWHVCASPGEVVAHGSSDCADAADGVAGGFFAMQMSGPGAATCGVGENDVFGCGSLGAVADPLTCAPIDRFSGDLCGALGAPWSCGLDNVNEAANVTKQGPDAGGVLCCAN